MVAKELAEAGARVVLLEEGAQHSAAEFTARPRDMLPKLYRDAAQHATIGRPPILLPLGKAVGGTTLVNSGTCFRTPDHVLARWRDEFGLEDLTPEALAPHFARVEETLNVVPVPPELAGANAHVAKRGADALGWSGDFVRRNVARLRRLRRVRVRLPGEREAARRRVVHPEGPRRRRHHLHGRDRAPARARRRGVHDRRRAPARRRAARSSSPPAPSTRPPCSRATASAARSSAATSRSTPPPRCGR